MCCYDICRSFAWGRWNSGSQRDRHERQKHQWCLRLTGTYQFHFCDKVIWPCKDAGPPSNQYLVLSRILINANQKLRVTDFTKLGIGREKNLCRIFNSTTKLFNCIGKNINNSLMNDFWKKRFKRYMLKILSIICALHTNDL